MTDNQLVNASKTFDAAIDAMATSTLTLEARLVDAENRFSMLKSEDFPVGPLRNSFDAIRRELNNEQEEKDKRPASQPKIASDKAERVAQSIVDLAGALRSARDAIQYRPKGQQVVRSLSLVPTAASPNAVKVS